MTEIAPTARLEGGSYEVLAVCPQCGESAVLSVSIASRLVSVAGEASRLGVRVKASKATHDCDQLTIAHAIGESSSASS
jgi:hypothetical protein